jgi:hypothetical protein
LAGAIDPEVGSNVTGLPVAPSMYTEKPVAGSTTGVPVEESVRGVKPDGMMGAAAVEIGRPVVVLKLTGAVLPVVGSYVTGPLATAFT